MFFDSKNKSDCCGCGTCSMVCPKSAIAMTEDECGFMYPATDPHLCINCGSCERSCIFAEKLGDCSDDTGFYAIRSKDDGVVRNSSSGGFFTLMAEEIFSVGGAVYGVAYGEGFRVEHRRADSMEQAEAFRTSKYVQSDTSELYASVREELSRGRTVLVTGTPCQIAGLKEYLACAKTDTSRLYTCDNICHGVSSPLVFADYLSAMQKYVPSDDRITSINMRHKRKAGGTVLKIGTEKGGEVREAYSFSYYRLYFNRVVNRPSCFECRYTSYGRAGDISVGDFWNTSNADFEFDTSFGVNEVLVNTDKGRELFDKICKKAYFKEVSREKAWQPHLEYATQKPKNYDAFWEEYLSGDNREQTMRKYLRVSPLFKVISTVTPVLRKTGLYSLFGKLYKAVFVKKQ